MTNKYLEKVASMSGVVSGIKNTLKTATGGGGYNKSKSILGRIENKIGQHQASNVAMSQKAPKFNPKTHRDQGIANAEHFNVTSNVKKKNNRRIDQYSGMVNGAKTNVAVHELAMRKAQAKVGAGVAAVGTAAHLATRSKNNDRY